MVSRLTSTVHYHDDDHPHTHVPVNGYPVSVNENTGYGNTLGIKTVTNSEGQVVSNYELVYESNVLKVHPRLIRIAALDATKAYGGTEPALKWTVDGEIIKPTSEMLGIKAVRDSGENVRDEGYTIRISYEKSTASNYIVETNDAKMTITPVPLTIVFGNQERYYGEDNKNDYTLTVVGLKHGDTADVALKNNDGATAKVLETAKNTLSDYINLTYNKYTDVGSNYLYGDKSYCEEHTILVPRENADGGYNYTIANYTPGVLTIKPRPMLLEVTGWQKELGDADKVQDFTLTDMITHNSVNGQQKLGAGSRITDASVVVNPDKVPIVFNLVRAEGEEVGSYPVYSTPQDRQIGNLAANDQKQLELDNPNYDFEYRYANDLIVKRQGLMITVDDKVRYYGDRVNRFYDGSTDYTYHVFVYPQGFSITAAGEIQKEIKRYPRSYVVDIGGYTTDVIRFSGRGNTYAPDLSFCESYDRGVIELLSTVESELRVHCSLSVDDYMAEAILAGNNNMLVDENAVKIAKETADNYATALIRTISEKIKDDFKTSYFIFMGGGSAMMRESIERAIDTKNLFFLTDVTANAKGYEIMARAKLTMSGEI